MAGDLDAMAADDAREGAADLRALPLEPCPRLSPQEIYSMGFVARYLWSRAKRDARQSCELGGNARTGATVMRDAFIVYRLSVRARATGGSLIGGGA